VITRPGLRALMVAPRADHRGLTRMTTAQLSRDGATGGRIQSAARLWGGLLRGRMTARTRRYDPFRLLSRRAEARRTYTSVA